MSAQSPASAAPDPPARLRSDAQRNKERLLTSAATVFVRSGVDAPIREIALEAGIGVATVYRHFPTRADLVVAVYRHQVEACAEAGQQLLATEMSAFAALVSWFDLFVDFLVTKHGLAAAMQSNQVGFHTLLAYFEDRLVPIVAALLEAARRSGEIETALRPYELMRGVGNLCIDRGDDPPYEPRRLVVVLLEGLRRTAASPAPLRIEHST